MKPKMTEKRLRVADYTDMPVGRDGNDGPKNGKDYLDNHVKKALEDHYKVVIDFNGTLGTTPSFLEEVFGGLIRDKIVKPNEYKARVEVIYRYQSVLNNIENYVAEATKAL